MQDANWAAVVEAIACYDDTVLAAAQTMMRQYLRTGDDDYDVTELRAALAADPDNIGSDYLRLCWQHDAIEAAVQQYRQEDHWDAMCAMVQAMIVRSKSWEVAFV